MTDLHFFYPNGSFDSKGKMYKIFEKDGSYFLGLARTNARLKEISFEDFQVVKEFAVNQENTHKAILSAFSR